ncbi:MAG: glycosyltransferase [Bacteroidales bacterium]|nr:glycosyltransferase [Bacteroidales bacterium]
MSSPSISILVPIYNVEPYLQRCIGSVLSQDFTDYELILVDDGSPDRCPAICDEASAKDQRIKVIHKANGGLPSARLAGFEVARGEFVVFLDSDDWLLPGALTMLHHAMMGGDYDIVKTRPSRSDGRSQWLESYPTNAGEIEGSVAYAERMNYNLIHPYLHSGIYRKSVFTADVFRSISDAGISFGEDWFANMMIAPNVMRVLVVDEPSHVYYVNSESIVGNSILSDGVNRQAGTLLEDCLKPWNDTVWQMVESKRYIGKLIRFFAPEVPFTRAEYDIVHNYYVEHPAVRRYSEAKHLRFFDCYAAYWLYVHAYRFLFKWIRLKGRTRKLQY